MFVPVLAGLPVTARDGPARQSTGQTGHTLSPDPGGPGMTGKSLLYTAAVSLAVVVAYEKYAKAGKPGAARIGN